MFLIATVGSVLVSAPVLAQGTFTRPYTQQNYVQSAGATVAAQPVSIAGDWTGVGVPDPTSTQAPYDQLATLMISSATTSDSAGDIVFSAIVDVTCIKNALDAARPRSSLRLWRTPALRTDLVTDGRALADQLWRGQRGRQLHRREQHISILTGGQGFELFPPVNHRGGIDFRYAPENTILEFLPGLHTDVPQEGPRHLAEKRFDDVEP